MAQQGSFRESLDLGEILPAYKEHLGAYGGTVGINFVDADKASGPDPFAQEVIPAALYAQRALPQGPERIGTGPATCSTCTDVVSARPTFAWDVNGWYRVLGVPWTYVTATSGMLSRAYIAAGGQRSARATYYLKRLLNRAVRASYDRTALGERFLDDLYVQEEMKAQAQAEASRRSAGGIFTDATDVLDEWGYLVRDDDEGGVDDGSGAVQDDVSPEQDTFTPVEWTYSYWLWRSHGCGIAGRETGIRLEQWQTFLVSALSARGVRVQLAVGLMGEQSKDYAVQRCDGYPVVFLSDTKEPTPAVAVKAVNLLVHYLKNNLI